MDGKLFDREGLQKQIKSEWKEFETGTRWKCIRCGKCCKTEWSLNITWPEYFRTLEKTVSDRHPEYEIEVDPESGFDHPFFTIRGKCPYLDEKRMACLLHPDWFYTCATYPFLLMPDGRLLYHSECSGFGHGRVMEPDLMKKKIMRERKKAGMVVEDPL